MERKKRANSRRGMDKRIERTSEKQQSGYKGQRYPPCLVSLEQFIFVVSRRLIFRQA